jgi:hypothetical protein
MLSFDRDVGILAVGVMRNGIEKVQYFFIDRIKEAENP